MSWDVIIINSKDQYPVDESLNFEKVPSFGLRSEVQDKISVLFPDTNWQEPSYAHLSNEIFIGHISLGDNEILDGDFTLYVYGGADPLKLISMLCNKYHWTAYDTTAMEYLDIDNPKDDGWNEFQAFRQSLIDDQGRQVGKTINYSITEKKWWQFWK